jgi:LemA protein
VVTAKLFGYKVMENYGVDREYDIRRDPEVKFDLPASATAR